MILAKIVVKSIVDFFILISLVDIGEVSTEIIIGVVIVSVNLIVLPLVEILLGVIQSWLKHKFPNHADRIDEIFKHATKQLKKKIEDKTKKDDKDKE
jgi:hypothetical protein